MSPFALSARLGLVEFGVLPLGVAKRALRALRAEAGGPAMVRAGSVAKGYADVRTAAYVPRSANVATREAAAAEIGHPGTLSPHTVIVPRVSPRAAASRKFNPVRAALHETGHAADPRLDRAFAVISSYRHMLRRAQAAGGVSPENAGKAGARLTRATFRLEKRANQNVARAIAKTGSPADVAAWKQAANEQIKRGYRLPHIRKAVAAARPLPSTREPSFGETRDVLRAFPFLRKKFTALAARWISSRSTASSGRGIDTAARGVTPHFFSLAQYKLFKKTADEDKDRGLANMHKAGLAGAAAGALMRPVKAPGGTLAEKLSRTKWRRAGVGYVAGSLAVGATRLITEPTKDAYGDRRRWAKHAEKLPMLAGIVGAGILAKRRFGLADRRRLTRFERKPKKELPPWARMGLSAGITGGVVSGALKAARRGTTAMQVLRSIGAGLAVGGGGGAAASAVGTRILGKPRAGDEIAYTKRGALGGAIAGGTLAGAGTLLALRSKAGREWLRQQAKTWRPHQAILRAKPLHAAGIAAGAGSAIGAFQGADEGMQVDVISSGKKRRLAMRCAPILFGYNDQLRYARNQRYADPIDAWIKDRDVTAGGREVDVAHRQIIGKAIRTGRQYQTTARRGTGLVSDAIGAARGIEKVDSRGRPLKREWEKAWFRNAVTAAAIGVGVLGVSAARRYARVNPGTKLGGAIRDVENKVVRGQRKAKRKAEQAGHWVGEKLGLSKRQDLAARLRPIHFDLAADMAGWDLRDPRGRSARVYAPGARTRERREKKWHEKVANIRAMALIGGIGALGIGAAGGYILGKRAAGPLIRPRPVKPGPAKTAGERMKETIADIRDHLPKRAA